MEAGDPIPGFTAPVHRALTEPIARRFLRRKGCFLSLLVVRSQPVWSFLTGT